MADNNLYTVNQWNWPRFAKKSQLNSTNPFGVSLTTQAMPSYINWSNPAQQQQILGGIQSSADSFSDEAASILSTPISQIAQPDAPQSNFLKDAFSKDSVQEGLKAGLGAAAGVVGGFAQKAISSGRESGVGNAIGTLGSTVGSAVSAVNPVLGAAITVGSNILGGTVNRAFGMGVDKAALTAANSGTDALRNFSSTAGSFDAVKGPDAVASVGQVYKGGWFTGSKARSKNNELKRQRREAESWANRSVENNIHNIASTQMDNLLANYSAFGGPLDYGLAMDYLTMKRKELENKNKVAGIQQVPVFLPERNPFALGGVMQSHGGDWTNGTVHIDSGGSHESSPYEGVQVGVDSQGVPNLVEEGERIFNDYVYSKRIFADAGTLEKFHLSKKRKITFADLAELLERESKERETDPISIAGLKAQMQQLADEQERQKQEMEAERARAAFEALSPEEQTAIMRQQVAQEATEPQAVQQPTPEEMALMQQQLMADGSEGVLGQEPEDLAQMQQNVNALGGRLVKASEVKSHKFAEGGRKVKRFVQKYNEDWFKQMAKSLGITDAEMEDFKFTDDPDANLTAFNNIYRDHQYNKAKDIYKEGQRQSKKNELFGDKGIYSYSDDKSKIYKARINDSDRVGWINKDYTGAVDGEGKMLGFFSQEEYDKLNDEQKSAYKRINEKAGNKMYDYNRNVIRDLYDNTEDTLLDQYDADYEKGFKWDDKDAQTVQYPIDIEHSTTSNLRYLPAIGGSVGIFNDLLSDTDYSRPQAIIDMARGLSTPEQVQPHYIGNYLTYRPLDRLYAQNMLNAQARATDRALTNNSGGNRGTAMAGLLANGYKNQIASGNLFRQAQEYNDASKLQTGDYNRKTDIFNATADMDAQKANASLIQDADRIGLSGIITGYGMMDDIDARKQASLNANLTNVFQSLGNIGEEAYNTDVLRWLEKTGTLKSSTLNANGGKLKKKKRGLTI